MKSITSFVTAGCLLAVMLIYTGCDPLANCGDNAPDPEFYQGEITGPDASLCPCCGGWFLNTSDTTFLFDQLPPGSTIDLNNASAFPIPVKFDYEPDASGCGKMLNRIILIQIEQL